MAVTIPVPITDLPPAPNSATDSVDDYDGIADTFQAAEVGLPPQINAIAAACYANAIEAYNSAVAAVNSPSSGATSTTSMSIAAGSKTFTVQTGKTFYVGQFATVAYTTQPRNLMHGVITAYNSGSGSMTVYVARVDAPDGAGPYTAWTVAVAGPQAAVGAQTISVPASAMRGRITNGATLKIAETATNKNMLSSMEFVDGAAQIFAQFEVMMPKSWDLGAVSFQPVWSGPSAGGVVFGLQGVAIGDGDALDVAFGTAQVSVDSWISATVQHTGPASSPITVAGPPAIGDRVQFQVYRDPAHASDTIAGTVSLIALVVIYTTNAPNDA